MAWILRILHRISNRELKDETPHVNEMVWELLGISNRELKDQIQTRYVYLYLNTEASQIEN